MACSFGVLPLGCGGEENSAQLDLQIDYSPIDRENGAVVHSYSGILRQVRMAVVSVYSQRMVDHSGFQDHPNLQQFFGKEGMPREQLQRGVGSGVIVSSQGYVLTNNHVIEDAERIIVQMADNQEIEAQVVGRDPATDIAVLRINANRELPTVTLGDSDQVEVGDVVFAMGNALGIGLAVTSGIVSARGRTGIGILGEGGYEDFIQTDASMNVGNSGGPLVDTWGRVIAINTAIASPGGGNVGIGFAIPINMARDVMKSLIETGEVRRGYLGVSLQDPERIPVQEYGAPGRDNRLGEAGIFVVDVVAESPAAEAGLREGDLLVTLNGKSVDSATDLRLNVAQLEPGTDVRFEVIRDGERIEVSAVLGNLEEAQAKPEITVESTELLPGLSVAALTPEIRESVGVAEQVEGLLVTEVATGSPHIDVFPVGAVILQINRESVGDVEAAHAAMKEGRNLFLILHEGAFHYLMIEVDRS